MEFSWRAQGNAHFQNNVFVSILLLSGKGDTIYAKNHTRDNKVNIAYLAPDDYRLILKAYKNNQLGTVLEKSIVIPKLLSER
ncbi:MAG: hypothetical protein IPH94_19520, partial [Saprospiraceae bacterium]|nr:hypothetical protein [Saprospiraceae bacterium]